MTSDVLVFLGVCVTAIFSCIGVIVSARTNTKQTENAKKAEQHAKRRERESRLSMDLMHATLELADVTAFAVGGGKVNGNIEEARSKAKTANEAYEAFLRDETARQMAK